MPSSSDTPKRDHPTVIVDTGRCRIEHHPVYGVIIRGALTAVEIDGKTVIVPAR